MLRIVALMACVLASTALAQDLRWNLPDRGAARYERNLRDEAKVEPEGAWDSRPWSGPAPAAVVLDGELDAKKKRTTEPLCDLRDLLPRLCLDLSQTKAGKTKLELRSDNVGVDVEAIYEAVAADGAQQIEATFVDWRPRELGAQRGHRPLVKGSLRGTRVLDRENGRVARFDGELRVEAQWFENPRTVRCTVRDEWTFTEILAPQDAKVRAMVADAIRKATESLEKNLQRLCDQNAPQGHDPYHDHHPGELALALLAIVKGGGNPKSDAVQKAYDNLRRRNIEGTYSLGAAILAIEALYTPIGEWQSLREGTIDAPMVRKLSADDFAVVSEWTKRLLDNLDTTTDPADVRRYHYGPSKLWDNSTTQYALLGLYAAQLCGVEISPQVWSASAKHLLTCDRSEGKESTLLLTSHADRERIEQGKKATRAGGKKFQPSGFGYQDGNDLTGSMTTAGVSGLSLCAAALRAQKKGAPKLLSDIDAGVKSGFLWLQDHLTVRRNPGPMNAWQNRHLYYLYGLERACELNQVAWIGGRDWYFEGAMCLLAQQDPSGNWGDAISTSFALLFLKKSALPAITGR
jgi:hypothetical protein